VPSPQAGLCELQRGGLRRRVGGGARVGGFLFGGGNEPPSPGLGSYLYSFIDLVARCSPAALHVGTDR